jgi:cyclopropane fatty-acyl-phospholipid synthase-like methyltransferase
MEAEMERLSLDKLPRQILSKMDLDTAFMASRIIIAAERLQLFRRLHEKKLSASSIRELMQLSPRYLTLFLDALVSMGMLHKDKDLYSNSPLAEKYYIQERPIFWTRQFSAECVKKFEAISVLEKVLKSGKDSWATRDKKRQSYLESMKKHPQEANDFTQMLFYYHQEDAEALAEFLDLSEFTAVLDVGGGSGVMSIALIKRNPHLRGCVMDIEPVCPIAEENIREAGLSDRIITLAGDFKTDLPSGYDVIMCCDIGPIQKNLLSLANKKLPDKGMVLLVDRFLSEDRTEPLDRIMNQLAGSEFSMETKSELTETLRSCGFREIKNHKIYKDVWIITGRKT